MINGNKCTTLGGELKMKRWIWEQEDYPNFSYDTSKLQLLLEKASKEQGYLSALMDSMSRDMKLQRQSEALLDEAINTSAIEGEILNRDSVKASINSKFGFKEVDHTKIDKSTDNLLELLIDANTNYDEDLTLDRLYRWHYTLFENHKGLQKITIGDLRGDATMQVVGGGYANEKVFYEAPPRERLERELEDFLQWFNTTEPSLIKAAITHLWFVIIHPFDDGNGRIARALSDLVLSKIEESKIAKLYSMSTTINKSRNSYYKTLEQTTGYIKKREKYLDITGWCEWFLGTLHTSLLDAKDKINHIFEKTKFWDTHRDKKLNARQIKVLNFILDIGVKEFKGNLSKKKYVSISGAASTTASRDLAELLDYGCIRQAQGTQGRNVSYEIVM
jgi:Fic family protein